MLCRDPDQRPQTAAAVAEELAAIGGSSRLKRLLRDAMRQRDTDSLPPSVLLPSIMSTGSGVPPKRRNWMAGGLFAVFIIVAAIVFKIQTDVGDLVLHSDADDLTVVIKRGDEVVDRLKLESGIDNRKTLHKGTYRIEIEGGGDALVLSDEVVTIGRGSEHSVDVVPRSSFASDRSETAALDISATPSPAPDVAGFTMVTDPLEICSHNGKTLDQWLSALKTETAIEGLGEAAFGAIGALQDAELRGLANDELRRRVVRSILERARDHGGLGSKLPPLAGAGESRPTPSKEAQSGHFMWYLSEVFGEPSFDVWFASAVDELVDGNSESRAAVLYCLHKYIGTHTIGGGMGGMGGNAGGMSVYGSMGGNKVDSKFNASRLIRCCIGLASDEAWPDFDPVQKRHAQSIAHEIVIKISAISPHGFSNEIYEQLIASIRRVPESQRSEVELQHVPPIHGTIEPQMFDQPEDQPAMDDGHDADDVDVASEVIASAAGNPSPSLLYQGKDLKEWMNALRRERDINSLELALKAVELLTRDESKETRMNAARESMAVARRLGGMVAGGKSDPNPSHHFMSFFNDVFVAYMPSPGLQVVAEELREGNRKSQMAGVWTTMNFLSGVRFESNSATQNRIIEQWGKDAADDPETAQSLRELRELLVEFAADVSQDSSLGFERDAASDSAINSALELVLLLGDDLKESAAMTDYLRNLIDRFMRLESSQNGVYSGSGMLTDSSLVAAIRLADGDAEFGTAERWGFFAREIVKPRFHSANQRFKDAFGLVRKAAPDELMRHVHVALSNTSLYGGSQDLLPLMVEVYAQDHADAAEVSAVLQSIKDSNDLTNSFYANLRKAVANAEETLNKRADRPAP